MEHLFNTWLYYSCTGKVLYVFGVLGVIMVSEKVMKLDALFCAFDVLFEQFVALGSYKALLLRFISDHNWSFSYHVRYIL